MTNKLLLARVVLSLNKTKRMKRYHILPYHYWLFLHISSASKVRLIHWGRNFLLGLLILTSFCLVAQIAYPANRALPFTRIDSKNASFKTKKQLASQLNKLNYKTVSVFAGENKYEPSLESIGLTVLSDKTAETVINYPLSKRLIPFSIFFSAPDKVSFYTEVNEEKAAQFAQKIVDENSSQPVDAVAKLEDKTVQINESKNGYKFNIETVMSALTTDKIEDGLQMRVPSETIQPQISTESAKAAASVVHERLGKQLEITADSKKVIVGADTLKDWVVLAPNLTTGKIDVSYSHEPIVATLGELANQVYIPAGSNKIVYFDGAEIDRVTNAAGGRVLVMEDSLAAVVTALSTQETTVAAVTREVAPGTAVEHRYSRSSKGVGLLIDNWVRSNGGNYGVVLQALDGSGIRASYNESKQYTSASVYKIYIASLVYQRVGRGEINLNSGLSNGYTVSACIEKMIVYSDNGCAIALGYTIGWSANDPTLRSQGFSGTTLSSGAHLTTAHDTAKWMEGLYDSSLVSGGYREALIGYLGRNIYRFGIPAGSPAHVADKVGMLAQYNHDVAIVFHPKGAYILSVMSSGSSLYRIADLAKQVAGVMGQ